MMEGFERLDLSGFAATIEGSDEFEDEGLDLLTDEEMIALEMQRYSAACAGRFVAQLPEAIREAVARIELDRPEYAVTTMRRNWSQQPRYTRGCLLCSPPGRGKTVAACWAALRMIELYHQPASFIHVPTYANYIGLGMGNPRTWEKAVAMEDRIEEDSRIIVLDDLGRERDSQATRDRAGLLVDHMWRRRARCVVTTNLAPSQVLGRYGDYVSSRLLDANWITPVVCCGPDNRLEAKQGSRLNERGLGNG